MVSQGNLIRRALSAELAVAHPGPLEAYRSQFLGAGTPQASKSTEAESATRPDTPQVPAAAPYIIPMVYPFEANLEDEQLEDHIIESLSSVKKFPVLLRGITGYPGGFVLLNVKAGNDRLILMHDLLHQGLLKGMLNPLFSYFPHVLLFRCPSAEATRDAVVLGQSLQQGFEATVEAVRIESINQDGSMELISAIDLEV